MDIPIALSPRALAVFIRYCGRRIEQYAAMGFGNPARTHADLAAAQALLDARQLELAETYCRRAAEYVRDRGDEAVDEFRRWHRDLPA